MIEVGDAKERQFIGYSLARTTVTEPAMRCDPISQKYRCGGFTLIEVLISLVVISAGLLGVAALQMRSLQNNYDALLRSHASVLAADIADRMRINRAAVRRLNAQSDYQIGFGAAEGGIDLSQARIDVLEWKEALAARLPEGDGAIDIAEDTGWVTIQVRWGERSDDPDGTQAITFVTETII